jgi:uncharacterized protein (TIGR00730 family)
MDARSLPPSTPPPARQLRSVCVFCGAAEGIDSAYRQAAEGFGRLLAARGMSLIFGGGRVGLMGAVAEAALGAGGEAIGVIPQMLVEREIAHPGLTRLHVVGSMFERKALMAELADAFVLLPGGYGSLDEFSEALTWAQLGLTRKPCGVLNVNGYYDRLLGWFDDAAREGFVPPAFRTLVVAETQPEVLLERLLTAPGAREARWAGDGGR